MRKFRFISISLLLVVFLVGCAQLTSFLGMQKSFDQIWAESTPKGKMAIAFSVYNKQYEDYKIQAANVANLSEPEKQVLRQRKQILVQMYPLIQSLDIALAEGKPFDPATESILVGLLRQLTGRVL